jgi:hypothetical protein
MGYYDAKSEDLGATPIIIYAQVTNEQKRGSGKKKVSEAKSGQREKRKNIYNNNKK